MIYLLPWEEIPREKISAAHSGADLGQPIYARKEFGKNHKCFYDKSKLYFDIIVFKVFYDNYYVHTWGSLKSDKVKTGISAFNTKEDAMDRLDKILLENYPDRYYLIKDNEEAKRFAEKLNVIL